MEKLTAHRKNDTSEVRVFRCSEKVTIEDIFESQQVNKLVIKGSPVHEFLSHQGNLSDLLLVEKSSFYGFGLDKLQNHNYVLIDEQKFAEYFADQNCHFDLAYPTGLYNDEMANVQIDEKRLMGIKSKFRNEIVIALSSKFVSKHHTNFGRNWLTEFNRAITKLEDSGKLKELQNKHWRNNCLHDVLASGGSSLFSSIFSELVISLTFCMYFIFL